MPSKYIVRLTAEERAQLEDLSRTGKRAAAALIHARILLKADVGEGGPGWDDGRITEALGGGASTVYRVRQAFVEEGLAVALFRKKAGGPTIPQAGRGPGSPVGGTGLRESARRPPPLDPPAVG